MSTLLMRARNGLFVTAIGLMLLSLIAPVVTLADTSLTPGTAAVVAGTNGDGVALRSDMSTASQVLQTLPEGTPLQIQQGPLTAADGSVWYSVSANGATGYVAAEFVSAASANTSGGTSSETSNAQPTEAPTQAATQAPVTGPAASTIPWKQPIAYGVANDNIGQGVPQIGIVCRADVSTQAAKIVEVHLGDTIEVTGQLIHNEGLTWLPVNCAGVGGFIDANFVAVNNEQSADPQATEAPTQAPTEVVTEAPTKATQADATQADPTEAATQVSADTTRNDTPATTTAPANDVTATVTATEAPTQTQTATEAPATGSSTADATATQAATVTETAPATTAPATNDASVTINGGGVTVNAGDVTVKVNAGGTPDATATTPPTTATATVAATESSHSTPAAAVNVTVQATVEATTPAATTAPTNDTANHSANDNANSTPTATTTITAPTAVATQDVSASATPGVDLSKAIGSAVVQGTNGDGVVCRVAPSSDAATITVLAEGTKVMVMGNPANGWLPIACADQLGYAPVQYMWQGGAVQGDFSGSGAGGTVTVQGTGGGLNCRSGAGTSYPVITVLPDGTTLTMRDQPSGDWLPVTCAGQNGWVFIQYVSAPQGGGSNGSNNGGSNGGSGATGTATVTGTGGDGVRCRASASTSGAIITVLPEGSTVTTTGAAANGWQPVTCAGQSGFVSSQYLTLGGSSGSNGDSSGGGNGSNNGGATGGTVTVTGTGNGLNCRSGAGTSYPVITVVFDGTTLTVRGAASNGWLPVVCASQNGFVSTTYVTASSDPGNGSNNGGSNNGGSNSGGSQVTGTATVTGTGGDGVRCRASASTSGAIITVVPEGATVSLTGNASNGWQPVLCGGQNGYISAQYLSSSGTSNGGGTPTPTPTPGNGGTTGGLVNGDHAQTTDVLNLRYQPSLGAGVATTAPAGTVVLITGGINNGFYPVDWDGLKGWMSGDYLVKTDAALSKRGGSADGGSTSGGSSGGTATGNAIVNYAMGYLGYPYVWATHGPSSFDCSGFTYWVILHVLGIDIGTGLWTQVNGGTPIARDAIQPGDLVFFQNTYEAGLSHVGIYIGNGKFIHAENEQTGVRISELGSDYYSSRWYGAVRYS